MGLVACAVLEKFLGRFNSVTEGRKVAEAIGEKVWQVLDESIAYGEAQQGIFERLFLCDVTRSTELHQSITFEDEMCLNLTSVKGTVSVTRVTHLFDRDTLCLVLKFDLRSLSLNRASLLALENSNGVKSMVHSVIDVLAAVAKKLGLTN